jgi:type I restriction enzyme S subunit
MDLKVDYLQTEVGLIPKDWSVKNLGYIGNVRMCKRVLKNQTSSNGDIPFYKIGTFGSKPDAFISKKHFDEFRKKYPFPNPGDILISAAGTIGRIVVYDGMPAYFQDSNIVWISNDESIIKNEYLYHYYQVIKWSVSHGGTVARLYNDNLKNKIFIAVPPIEEQNLISIVLNDIDDLISKLDKIIVKRQNIKRAVILQLLTGKIRLPGFSDEWVQSLLEDIADIHKGSGLSKLMLDPSGDNLCILYGELFTTYNRRIVDIVSRTKSKEGIKSVSGDILLPSSTTTTGSDLAIASALLLDNVALGGDIIIIRRKIYKYDPIFLAYLITQTMKKEITERAQGTTIHHLYGKDLKNLYLRLPSLNEQIAISKILVDMENEIFALEKRLNKTKALKQAMMQELLTGKTRLVNKELIDA